MRKWRAASACRRAPVCRCRSWEEALHAPAFTVADVDEAVMKAVWAILPEFDPPRHHAPAGPARRPRNGPLAETARHLGKARLERLAARHRARLVRRPGADLALPRAGGEIGVGFGRCHSLHGPFDAHLTQQRFPMEAQGGARIGREFFALAAIEIRVKNETRFIDPFQEDHAR